MTTSTTAPAVTGRAQGRAVARVAFVLGIAVSIAANVAHTWHPSARVLAAAAQRGIPADQWRPEIGAQLSAAFYPLALLLTVEIVTRVSWRSDLRFTLARFGGTGAVALVAAIVSYRHMNALLTAYGEDALTAAIGPFAVDGLMFVASVALTSLASVAPAKSAATETAVIAPDQETGPVPPAKPKPKPTTKATRAPARKPVPVSRSDAELLEQARAADLAHRAANNGRPISFENLGKALKVAKPKANELARAVRAEADQRQGEESGDRVDGARVLSLAGVDR